MKACAILLLFALFPLTAFADPVVEHPVRNVLHRPVPGTSEWMTWRWTASDLPYALPNTIS